MNIWTLSQFHIKVIIICLVVTIIYAISGVCQLGTTLSNCSMLSWYHTYGIQFKYILRWLCYVDLTPQSISTVCQLGTTSSYYGMSCLCTLGTTCKPH